MQRECPGQPYRRKGWPTACLGTGEYGDLCPECLVHEEGVAREAWRQMNRDRHLGRAVAVVFEGGRTVVYRIAANRLSRRVEDLAVEDLAASDWGLCDLAAFQEWAARGWRPDPARRRG